MQSLVSFRLLVVASKFSTVSYTLGFCAPFGVSQVVCGRGDHASQDKAKLSKRLDVHSLSVQTRLNNWLFMWRFLHSEYRGLTS